MGYQLKAGQLEVKPFVVSLKPFVVSLKPFVVSLSNHEGLNRPPFDRLRANA